MNRFMASPIPILLYAAAAVFAACNSYDTVSPLTPTTVSLQLAESTIEVGQTTTASATARDRNGALIDSAGVTFTSYTPGIATVSSTTGQIRGIAPGTTQITATVDGKSDQKTITVFMSPIRINEVKPDGDLSGGWVEIYNSSEADVDLSNWEITTGDGQEGFTIPAGAVLLAGGYRVINETALPAQLNAADAVHLFSRWGVEVDTYSWTVNPTASYARCPNGSGPFIDVAVLTRAAANTCPPTTYGSH
jgi:Lamin Tail Domain/Bacterial Ig-like domain (group 2)